MLYVVRHGETVWNVDHRVQGQTDVPLTEKGKEEIMPSDPATFRSLSSRSWIPAPD